MYYNSKIKSRTIGLAYLEAPKVRFDYKNNENVW